MPDRSRRSRAGTPRIAGRTRATYLAQRLGIALREARRAAGLTQAQVAAQAGVSQTWLSQLERGLGACGSIESWASVGAAVGHQLAAFLERAPGASRPADHEHLKRQQLVIGTARRGGWRGTPEEQVDLDRTGSRSIDVFLQRIATHEAAVVEIWNLIADGGAAMRSLDAKVSTLDARMNTGHDVRVPMWQVRGLWIVRGTRRNRELIGAYRDVFGAKFPASSLAWLRALTDSTAPMPVGFGPLWTDVSGTRLLPTRLGSRHDAEATPARVATPPGRVAPNRPGSRRWRRPRRRGTGARDS